MKKLTILLVEDNKQDAFLVREALEDKAFLKEMHHVVNGKEAIKYLKKETPFENSVLPDLILMDINMPIMDGHEALREIKSLEDFKHIPILMLTTSSRKEDILKAYKEQSSSYIVKPDDIFDLDHLAESLRNYWTNTVRLPNKNQ